VSAFIAEPVVGATAGVLVPREGYFQRIREICDRYDVLLIVDEVMTGAGRTGAFFAMEHWGVQPDMIVCAKGLASGYSPIYCLLTTEGIRQAIMEGNGAFVHGHTYSQNPLSCAIAMAVLQYIEDHDLVRRSREMGALLLQELESLHELDIVGDVRGLGLFAGVEFVRDKASKAPFDPQLKLNTLIGARCLENGLIVYPGGGGADGVRGDHVVLAPPFVINEAQVRELVSILKQSISEVMHEHNLG
jgi:adenosylmethionine-8-amino-7-oxononanoate aminotransferase